MPLKEISPGAPAIGRRKVLRAGLAAGSLFLPLPWALVRANSEGTLKLLRVPKLALVIGNSKYKDAPELKNPANDARAIGEALKGAGFEATVKLDTGREDMLASIRAYVQAMERRKCVGLFYFAGHGVQLAWRNYLLPVDAAIDRIEDVAPQSIDIARLMEGLTRAANPMNVVILDACRENPFGKDFRVEQKGLSQMDAPNSTLLAYATSPGNVASDGEGANGLYTEHLLREMKVQEAKIEDVFKRVRLGVRRKSNGAQIPWESTSLEEDFYFLPPAQLKALSEKEKQRLLEEEVALWAKIEHATDPAAFEDYLRRYPSGNFAELAQLQLDRLLAKAGEKRIQLASAEGNPFTKGSVTANVGYKVGDAYTLREIDLYRKVEGKTWTATITEVTDSEVRFDDGRVLDLLGNVKRWWDGRQFEALQNMPLEFVVGKRWNNRFRVILPKGGTVHAENELRITAREPVTIPAGTFDAYRIEGRGVSYTPRGAVQNEIILWRAPEKVRTFLAREERNSIGGGLFQATRTELLSYKQA